MAARKKTYLNEKARSRIQSSMLVNALMNHVVGKNDMSSTQIRAAEILLRKALPDLTATTLTGGDGETLKSMQVKFK